MKICIRKCLLAKSGSGMFSKNGCVIYTTFSYRKKSDSLVSAESACSKISLGCQCYFPLKTQCDKKNVHFPIIKTNSTSGSLMSEEITGCIGCYWPCCCLRLGFTEKVIDGGTQEGPAFLLLIHQLGTNGYRCQKFCQIAESDELKCSLATK